MLSSSSCSMIDYGRNVKPQLNAIKFDLLCPGCMFKVFMFFPALTTACSFKKISVLIFFFLTFSAERKTTLRANRYSSLYNVSVREAKTFIKAKIKICLRSLWNRVVYREFFFFFCSVERKYYDLKASFNKNNLHTIFLRDNMCT